MFIDDMVSFAVSIANDNKHGYSQKVRSLYNEDGTSYDCSSLVLTAIYHAFKKYGMNDKADYIKRNCSYTGNMRLLTNVGFKIVATNPTTKAGMRKGDIYLNETHHVAMAVDANNIVHARSSEGTTDTRDNSGNEIRVQPWYLYSKGWGIVLRYEGVTPSKVNTESEGVFMFSMPTIKKGAKGNDVKVCQALLKGFGYDIGKWGVDGDFGASTDTAIRKFQYDNKLTVDGIVGGNTWKALLKR